MDKNASKQKRIMAMIIGLLPRLEQSEWSRRCAHIYASDAIKGPEAMAWGLNIIAALNPPGMDRNVVLEEMDKAKKPGTRHA